MTDTPNDMPSELKLTAKSQMVGCEYNQTICDYKLPKGDETQNFTGGVSILDCL